MNEDEKQATPECDRREGFGPPTCGRDANHLGKCLDAYTPPAGQMRYFAEPSDDVGGWGVGHGRPNDETAFLGLARACTKDEAKVMVNALNAHFHPANITALELMELVEGIHMLSAMAGGPQNTEDTMNARKTLGLLWETLRAAQETP